jgi:hypothetical protein
MQSQAMLRTGTFIREVIGVVLYVLLFAFLLFVPAGTTAWPRAWILLGVLLAVRLAIMVSVLRVNGELLRERQKFVLQQDQPLADKILLPGFMASFAAQIAFASLDRFHLRLLPPPGPAISTLGLPLFAIGWVLVGLALRTNAFADRHRSLLNCMTRV